MAAKTKCKDKCKKKTRKDAKNFTEDYKKSLKKLYDNIVVEACEKASEIDVSTEEEFEKLKKLYSKRLIDDIKRDYDRKERNVLIQTGTYYSSVHNAKRMGEIGNKLNHIQTLKKEIEERVEKEMQNEDHYKDILRLLILEGLYKLLEPNVTIRCRENDTNILQTLLKPIEEAYNKETQQSLALKIDGNNHLPKNVHGIHMVVKEGKILLENTLNSRIDQIFEKIIPTLKLFLFAGSDSKSRNVI